MNRLKEGPGAQVSERERGNFYVRCLCVLVLGALQGVLIRWTQGSFILPARLLWRNLMPVTLFLLPLPVYLFRWNRRLAAGLLLWGALLASVDLGWIVFRHPLSPFSSAPGAMLSVAAAGFLLLLPMLGAWIEEGKALPEWRTGFEANSRVFFTLLVALLLVGIAQLMVAFGAHLLRKAGFYLLYDLTQRNPMRDKYGYFYISTAAASALAIFWISRREGVADALRRSGMAVLALLLPLLSFFVVLFCGMLPFGVENLWSRGFDSTMLLTLEGGMIFLTLAAWRGGRDEAGNPVRPFMRPVRWLVLLAIALLPVLGALSVYTIGLRVRQYDWTIARVAAMTLAAAFLLWTSGWTLLWAKRRDWISAFGDVNRAALPLLGLFFVFLVSPPGDMRRFVASRQLAWLYAHPEEAKEAYRFENYEWKPGFDYDNLARNLGIWGYEATQRLSTETDAAFARADSRFGPQKAGAVRAHAAEALEGLKWRTRFAMEKQQARRDAEERDKRAKEAFLSMPVHGGTLSDSERLRAMALLMGQLPHNAFQEEFRPCNFLLLADLNRDGEKELMAWVGEVMFLVGERQVYRMQQAPTTSSTRPGRPRSFLSESAAAGQWQVVPDRWDILELNRSRFRLSLNDTLRIEKEREKKTQ